MKLSKKFTATLPCLVFVCGRLCGDSGHSRNSQTLGVEFRLCHILVLRTIVPYLLYQDAVSSTEASVSYCSLLGVVVKKKGAIMQEEQ